MLSDYYVIGGCVLYIIGVGFCAYRCSAYTNKSSYLEHIYHENDDYKSINYSNV